MHSWCTIIMRYVVKSISSTMRSKERRIPRAQSC